MRCSCGDTAKRYLALYRLASSRPDPESELRRPRGVQESQLLRAEWRRARAPAATRRYLVVGDKIVAAGLGEGRSHHSLRGLRHRQDLIPRQLHVVHIVRVLLYGRHKLIVVCRVQSFAAVAGYFFVRHVSLSGVEVGVNVPSPYCENIGAGLLPRCHRTFAYISPVE
jgi:hypothetical protein